VRCGGRRDGEARALQKSRELHVSQPALLPYGAAPAPHARSRRTGRHMGRQGTYSQDWLLYDTDWNWRIDSKANGRSRTFGDIGTHWCDMIEHVTGLRITSLCADLQTFHKTRKRPKGSVE